MFLSSNIFKNISKRLIFLTILVTNIIFSSFASDDTIRIYDKDKISDIYYSSTKYSKQLARFDLMRPVQIKGIKVWLNGSYGSTAKMHIFGHEGGVFFPVFFNDLTEAVTITKTKHGVEGLYIDLENKNIKLANNQFFIMFDEYSPDIEFVTDSSDHKISCMSTFGGIYYYQYAYHEKNKFWEFPGTKNSAYKIDVYVNYFEEDTAAIFQEKTYLSGISTGLSNSSIASADFDNDGFTDLLITGYLYKNTKNGKFTNVTTTFKIKNNYSATVANAFVDMDNDMDMDIILFGKDSCVLFINDIDSFREQGLNLPKFPGFSCFSFADVNFDGYPDLFIGQKWQTEPYTLPNRFFINNKNNGFTDATTMIYPKWDGEWNFPNERWDPGVGIVERNKSTKASQWVDYNNDGLPDLYVVNDYLHRDEFYQNNGDGSFTNVIANLNIDSNSTGYNNGNSLDWTDFNNDGYIDLLLVQSDYLNFYNFYDRRGTAIYQNNGPPDYSFTDLTGQYSKSPGLTSSIGLEMEEFHSGGSWGDINNDGLSDLVFTNTFGCRYVDLYEQLEGHNFALSTYKHGLENISTGADLIFLDVTGNGSLDLALADNEKFRLFQNTSWGKNNYLELDLKSTSGNSHAIGSKAIVYAGGKKIIKEVHAGRGQKMQAPYRLHFGLGQTATIDSVVIYWATKPMKKEVFTDLKINSVYLLTEGGGITLPSKEPEQLTQIELYPNPVQNVLVVNVTNAKSDRISLILYSPIGQKVFETEIFSNSSGNIIYHLDFTMLNISEGLYILKIQQENSVFTKQVLHLK